MTNLITEARELCERATPGPWGSRIDVGKKYYVFTPGYGVRDFCCLSGGFEHESDAAFIARSRTLVPELCDALEKAEEKNKQLLHEVCKLACESIEREKTLARLEAEVVAALREKQERDKGCEHCKQCEDLAYGHDSMQRTGRIYLDGNLLTADLYSESMAAAVCYCPVCGKRLEVKHEAD